MDDHDRAARFAEHRSRLTAVAYRILGSAAEADDAVQETWKRLAHQDAHPDGRDRDVGGRLTIAVGRTCLQLLRHRSAPRASGAQHCEPAVGRAEGDEPEHEAMLSESLAAALLAVQDALAPAERVAFVMHDLFATPYDEVALCLGRSPTAVRQLASRARRRVQTPERTLDADRTVHGRVVEAFLTASRDGDVEELAWLLHPDAVLRADRSAVALGVDAVVVGADAVAHAFSGRARGALPALLDGFAAAAWSEAGRLRLVAALTVLDGRVTEVELIAEAAVLDALDLQVGSEAP